MITSRIIHSFTLGQRQGYTLITAREYPWSVLQVIPTTPEDFDRTVAALKERGMVACHDTNRTFCIIHLASGDHDGRHPERHINITQSNHKEFIGALKDTMAQAAAWYEATVARGNT